MHDEERNEEPTGRLVVRGGIIQFGEYHDTLFPDPQIPADPRMFLVWAPRERCYAHAINDPSCPRNAVHWKALLAWKEKFAGIDDSHTFEYYMDQLLFNGLHPFTPDVILVRTRTPNHPPSRNPEASASPDWA